ncbi:MAG: DEAD/DEAH box helicase family protein [Cyanobacteria bacterium SZAS LIN-5]|nr:DEAD/DEAH box helicase family protein [Cyanobacteria bacterium SZAS LIN-5]
MSQDSRNNTTELSLLDDLNFRFPLRKYQKEILDLVHSKIEDGEKQIHIVAPPGSGKTIIGLQLISAIKCPSLIISPNTTIQSQWRQKLDLFLPPDAEAFGSADLIGTHEDKPLKPITLLTYQVLSTPGREQEYLEKLARNAWIEELRKSRSMSRADAELRLIELLQHNPKEHQKELSRHLTRIRRKLTDVLELKEILHENALNLVQALRRQNIRLVIFDECHHLTDYWAAVMTQLVKQLDDPLIVGLTGTPPEGKSSTQETRYMSLVGEIDYQVPTPALVKEGGLAPFQDLVYFTQPTEREFAFLKEQHEDFHQLIDELIKPTKVSDERCDASELTNWISEKVSQACDEEQTIDRPNWAVAETPLSYLPAVQKVDETTHRIRFPKNKSRTKSRTNRINTNNSNTSNESNISNDWIGKLATPITPIAGWKGLQEHKPQLAIAYCRYMFKMQMQFPSKIEVSEAMTQAPLLEDWMILLEEYASHKLKVSSDQSDHKLYARIKSAAQKLGYGFTEQGLRKQASPVDRVLAFSNSKAQAVAKILQIEHRNLGDKLRAVVITDFERMSATVFKPLDGVLSKESGGAIDALRTLLATESGTELNPCLVTGSLLLTDKRITEQFVRAADQYIASSGLQMDLIVKNDDTEGFSEITASSAKWEPRFYVAMITEFFERGITKCLIGTRGLFGEGWDSQALNTLIDLTTTTSPVSVKQLRGRSIRLNANDPTAVRKCANNWDVVCIAPQLEKGLNDYNRFVRKHEGYFGITDDGQIECGVGHVHASLSELTPAEVFASIDEFNQEMTDRALAREQIYDLWKVGQPYKNHALGCIEISKMREIALAPPFVRRNLNYKQHVSELRSDLVGVVSKYSFLGASTSLIALVALHLPMLVATIPFIIGLIFAAKEYRSLFASLQKETCMQGTQESALKDIAQAVLSALQRRHFIPENISSDSIRISMRTDGTFRVLLDDVEPQQSAHFISCMKEALMPVTNQPYVIPKFEYFVGDNKSPESIISTTNTGNNQKSNQFFLDYLAGKAEPRIAAYYPVPGLLARSEKGREAFEEAWNKHVSPGYIVATETNPELLNRYFKMGPSLAQRLLWE